MIETDVLLACINARDKHHEEAVMLIRALSGRLLLSPFSLIELAMLIHAGKIRVVDYGHFMSALDRFLNFYTIEVMPDTPYIHWLAWGLRARYGLDFFNSLHASAAIIKDATLYSYDETYRKVRELKWRNPGEVLKRV